MRAFVAGLARDKIVVGDSRYHLGEFKGITLITPNESEATPSPASGPDADVEEVGRSIIGPMDVEALLITRGNKGMALFCKDGRVHHIPISGTDEIADVTGAGDTVAAAVTLASPQAPTSTRRRGSRTARRGSSS